MEEITTCKTVTATIYVGLRLADGTTLSLRDIKDVIQDEVDRIGWCVTVTETEFIYTDGREKGVAVGIINYPRFPESPKQLIEKVKNLAIVLLNACQQCRVSAVIGDTTYMWSNQTNIDEWEKNKEAVKAAEASALNLLGTLGMIPPKKSDKN